MDVIRSDEELIEWLPKLDADDAEIAPGATFGVDVSGTQCRVML